MRLTWKLKVLVLLFIILLVGLILKKSFEKIPIKIAFVGPLTGKYSVVSNSMIGGLILAFEEVNYTINGKEIQLIFKDDKQNKKQNEKVIQELIEDDVKIIVGNVTSQMTKSSLSIVNQYRDMFMISAASASTEFSQKDDQFFRVHVDNTPQRFNNFTNFLNHKGYKKVLGVFDLKNSVYTKNYLRNFEKSFSLKSGNEFVDMIAMDSDLDMMLENILQREPDMLLLALNSVDSAKLIQYLRLNNINTQVALASWSMTEEFIENGGKAIEGAYFNIDFDQYSRNHAYVDFLRRYRTKYKEYPSMFAAKAYEIGTVLIELLKKGNEHSLKRNLLKQRTFVGLQGSTVFDKYGDIIRDLYTFEVQNGKFIRIH